MTAKTKKKPTPEELLIEVQGQAAAKTYEFEDYLPVIHALQQKGHSYADIAEFIKDRLGISASRGQIYRAYQIWLADQSFTDEDVAEEERFTPPQTFEDEIAERVNQNAVQLIETLEEQTSRSDEPWDDAAFIIHRAAEILTERREAELAAEQAAADSDKKLDAKKGK